MITLILGGARSGKSSLAEKLAQKSGGEDVAYIATAVAEDEEMKRRITHHQNNRPSCWQTIEEPLLVEEALASLSSKTTVLIDCITVYLSNLLFADHQAGEKNNAGEINFDKKEKVIMDKMEKMVEAAHDKEVIIVSNEIGMGVVPAYKLGRGFRDIAGRVNQYLADKADKVYLTIAGLPVDLKDLSKKIKSEI